MSDVKQMAAGNGQDAPPHVTGKSACVVDCSGEWRRLIVCLWGKMVVKLQGPSYLGKVVPVVWSPTGRWRQMMAKEARKTTLQITVTNWSFEIGQGGCYLSNTTLNWKILGREGEREK